MKYLRVRWIPEDLPLEGVFSDSTCDIDKLAKDIDAGILDYLCAIVERRCPTCDTWEGIGSLGAIMDTPDSTYWKEVEIELLEEYADVGLEHILSKEVTVSTGNLGLRRDSSAQLELFES